jgi:hypothetical protein
VPQLQAAAQNYKGFAASSTRIGKVCMHVRLSTPLANPMGMVAAGLQVKGLKRSCAGAPQGVTLRRD